ncbi:MAG: helix-turn-helix transcriptional regulator [Cyclobacteriaceae bacterium]|nr:helix-turn-helix transcriptional regulator [Cyclobacteriaceae bacterium]
MNDLASLEEIKQCSTHYVVAINDTLNVISGKWKLPIIGSLLYDKKRFKELEADIEKITPRMLSKELKELELNGILKRTVYDTIPVKVEYELTESGQSLRHVLDTMVAWGLDHRQKVMV